VAAERDVGFAEDKIWQWGRYAGDPTPEQLTRAIEHLDSASAPTADSDQARLSPLQHEQVNLHGRYSFLLPDQLRAGELRPLLIGSDG